MMDNQAWETSWSKTPPLGEEASQATFHLPQAGFLPLEVGLAQGCFCALRNSVQGC